MRYVLYAVSALILVGCGADTHGVDPHAEDEGASTTVHTEDIVLTPEAMEIAGIETQLAETLPMQGQLTLPAVVTNTSHGRAVVTSPVDGKIVRLHVSLGDKVSAGTAIATVQSTGLAEASSRVIDAQRFVVAAESMVRESTSARDLAQARLKTATEVLARQRQFAKVGAFSQPAMQQAQKDLIAAEAELESATHEEELHKTQLARAERLFKQELISRTELEQAHLELQEDSIRKEKARRNITVAKASFQREEQIAQQGLSNSREIQLAESEVRAANLEVEQAKIRLTSAKSGVAGSLKGLEAAKAAYSAQSGGASASGGSLTIVAPIAGVVTHREVTIGQAVERTTEICEIENLKSVWVTAKVPEKDMAKVRPGARAFVTTKAHPGRVFEGVVQVIGSRLDPRSRTLPVQVLVDNSDGSLRADMFATVGLGVGSSGPALAVPRSAIVQDGDRTLLYVEEEPGVFEEFAVQTGRVQADLIEIVSGLEPGARVVVKGAFVLKSEKVKAELKGHEH